MHRVTNDSKVPMSKHGAGMNEVYHHKLRGKICKFCPQKMLGSLFVPKKYFLPRNDQFTPLTKTTFAKYIPQKLTSYSQEIFLLNKY